MAELLHDLRNPLTVTVLNSELLLNGAGGALGDEQKKYVTEIYESSKKMLDLMERMPHTRE